MFDRKHSKSVLQGMDFGKLEKSAMAVMAEGLLIHDSIITSPPTGRSNTDLYKTMLKNMQESVTGNAARILWGDDLYYALPEPHLKSKVDKLIDSFWDNPGKGHMHLYFAQLKKNPITRDLFKSESTTHHFPWYRMGSKY